jgi:autotransporter passenger strand-loop-strand repeat protein
LVLQGGKAINTGVSSGGTLAVASAGSATSTTIVSGGTEVVSRGGTDLRAQIVGGEQDLAGYASGAIVATGLQVVESAGTASGTQVSNGGTELIVHGGTARGTAVADGGFVIDSGGVVLSATVSGVATSGTLVLSAGGTASGAVLRRNGVEIVASGGVDRATLISKGALEVISAGGSTSGSVISGGTEELGAGAIVGGTITFGTGSGVLRIDSTVMPGNTIQGLAPGDTIDLAGVSYVSGGTVKVTSSSRVLQIVENGTTYKLNLSSSSRNSSYHYALVSDGHGGTEVVVTSATSTGPGGHPTSSAVGAHFGSFSAASLDQTAVQNLVYGGGAASEGNFFSFNSNGTFLNWSDPGGSPGSDGAAVLVTNGSAPDLLFHNAATDGFGLNGLGAHQTLQNWPDVFGAADVNASSAPELLFGRETLRGWSPTTAAGHRHSLHIDDDAGHPSGAFKVLR